MQEWTPPSTPGGENGELGAGEEKGMEWRMEGPDGERSMEETMKWIFEHESLRGENIC